MWPEENSFDDGSMSRVLGGGKVEPVTTAALLSAGSSVLGKAAQGSGPAGPSRAEGASRTTTTTEAIFNNSGWSVNFGDGAEFTARTDAGVSKLPAIGKLDTTTLLLLIAGGLLLWKMARKYK